jgi:hypothetical protein
MRLSTDIMPLVSCLTVRIPRPDSVQLLPMTLTNLVVQIYQDL